MESSPNVDAALASAVRKARVKAGLTQEQAARLVSEREGVGISATALAKIETGSRTVRYSEAVALSEALRFTLPGAPDHEESPEELRRRHLDLAARHMRSKVNSARMAVGSARARLNAAEAQRELLAVLGKAIDGHPAEFEAHDIQDFGRSLLSAIEEAGIPAQEFIDALELFPVDMYDHGPEPINADMDPGVIAVAVTEKYPLKIRETWTVLEDPSDA